jgi:serine/threonine protein kinase
VYLGVLHDGQKVAVKVPIHTADTNIADFKKDLRIQSRIKHKNVVKLLGYCLDVNVPKFVYEFAENGNLYDRLHGNNKSDMLLNVCLRIALDCAEALAYIHSSTDSHILHGDVKSANILLETT